MHREYSHLVPMVTCLDEVADAKRAGKGVLDVTVLRPLVDNAFSPIGRVQVQYMVQ